MINLHKICTSCSWKKH